MITGESYQMRPSWFEEWLGRNESNKENESGIDNHAEVGGTAEPTQDLSDPFDLTPYLPSNTQQVGTDLSANESGAGQDVQVSTGEGNSRHELPDKIIRL
eukprot:734172-Karenia_brevis.AAC.1